MDDLKAQLAQVIGSLGEIKGKMLVKEDLNVVKDRLVGVEKGQNKLMDQQENMRARLEKLEGERAIRPSEERIVGPRHRPIGPIDPTIELKNTEAFIAARRSLYLSPVHPHLTNLKDFLLNRMEMPADTVADLCISNIRKIHPRKMPAHRKNTDATKKVHVSFRDSQERDMVVSYAR